MTNLLSKPKIKYSVETAKYMIFVTEHCYANNIKCNIEMYKDFIARKNVPYELQ